MTSPQVRLLSNGEEPEKGSQLVLDAHELLRHSSLEFAGNTEGRTLLEGEADQVAVSEGESAEEGETTSDRA